MYSCPSPLCGQRLRTCKNRYIAKPISRLYISPLCSSFMFLLEPKSKYPIWTCDIMWLCSLLLDNACWFYSIAPGFRTCKQASTVTSWWAAAMAPKRLWTSYNAKWNQIGKNNLQVVIQHFGSMSGRGNPYHNMERMVPFHWPCPWSLHCSSEWCPGLRGWTCLLTVSSLKSAVHRVEHVHWDLKKYCTQVYPSLRGIRWLI